MNYSGLEYFYKKEKLMDFKTIGGELINNELYKCVEFLPHKKIRMRFDSNMIFIYICR